MTRPDEPSRRFDVRAETGRETGRRSTDPTPRTTIRRAPRRGDPAPG
jgi:hypothetical protein